MHTKATTGKSMRAPAEAKEIAKLFQTDAACAFIVEEGDGNFIMYNVPIPTTPQVVDRVTAETTKAIVSGYTRHPAVEALLSRCPRVIHVACSDRAGANVKADKSLYHEKSGNSERLHLWCDVHKSHTSQTHQLDLQKPVVSRISFVR